MTHLSDTIKDLAGIHPLFSGMREILFKKGMYQRKKFIGNYPGRLDDMTVFWEKLDTITLSDFIHLPKILLYGITRTMQFFGDSRIRTIEGV
jgi:hypothetical protein